MYNTAIPVMVTSPTFNCEEILKDLRLCGANRVFLAIDPVEYKTEKQEKVYEKLSAAISFFKKHNIETGVWFWAFWISGDSPFTPIKGFEGKESSCEKCPADPKFLDYMSNHIETIAKMGPDLIMFDDDLRFGFMDSGYGCICEHHLKMMSEIIGEEVSADGLFAKAFSGKPNKYRSAYLKAAGDSLKNYCRRMRETIDTVNPKIRLGACSCLSVWDADGVDSYTLAKIMAGKTKPFVRLIGAPYWAAKNAWGNRMEGVIELERMERSWYDGDDIEIFSEGDVYPRPRFTVAAAYLEIFDSALRASGNFDGILKYMLDYTSTTGYERGYIEKHLDNAEMYIETDRIFSDKKACGIRVYETMRKIEQADFSYVNTNITYIQHLFFSPASTLLSENAIPTTYEGTGIAGIAFGENARHLPESAFEKPLIIDILAARILTDMGIDVGVVEFGKKCAPQTEHFLAEDDYIFTYTNKEYAYELTLNRGSKVLSEFETKDKNIVPAYYTYTNANGHKYIVLNSIGGQNGEALRRNYLRPKQLIRSIEDFGEKMPAKCFDNPDIYMMCKKNENGMAIGLWNCFPDYCKNLNVTLGDEYKSAEFIGCEGTLCGNEITVKKLGAFEFCYINLTK